MAITVPVTGTAISSTTFGIPVANALNTIVLGDVSSNTAVTLTTTGTDVAGSAAVTFTLAVQARVKISVVARYLLGTTTNGRFVIQAGYNSGSSAVIGSVTKIAAFASMFNASGTAGANGGCSATTFGTVLLAAGTYTAYAAVQRANGGAASDTCSAFGTIVEAVGFN